MKSLIVCLVLLNLYDAQGQMYGGNWMSGLFDNINRMSSDIQQNVMSINQQIQHDVQQQVITASELQRTAEGGQTMSSRVNGGSFVVTSSPGSMRSVISGYDSNGQFYYRDGEDKIVGDILYHSEKIHYPSTNATNEFRYTLNLTDQTARPVLEENDYGDQNPAVN